jgi:hypothetical protein
VQKEVSVTGTIWSSCISKARLELYLHPTKVCTDVLILPRETVHLRNELTFCFAAVQGGLDLDSPFKGMTLHPASPKF